jgi:hypothetical protein
VLQFWVTRKLSVSLLRFRAPLVSATKSRELWWRAQESSATDEVAGVFLPGATLSFDAQLD